MLCFEPAAMGRRAARALFLALVLALHSFGCSEGEAPVTSSFCRSWMQLTPSGQDSVLDRKIREWTEASANSEAVSAQFLACVAEQTRARSKEVTRACRGNLPGIEAPAVLGNVIVRSAQQCAGVDMY